MNKVYWKWKFSKGDFSQIGLIEAVDIRDAVSRIMTASTPEGKLFGELHNVPLEVLDKAPGNYDKSLVIETMGFNLVVGQVCCPAHKRFEKDPMGCGGFDVGGPDDEGFFDCSECGLAFNPLTCNEPLKNSNLEVNMLNSFCEMFETLQMQFSARNDPAIGRVLKNAAAAYNMAGLDNEQRAVAMVEIVQALDDASKVVDAQEGEAYAYESEMESSIRVRNDLEDFHKQLKANAHRVKIN